MNFNVKDFVDNPSLSTLTVCHVTKKDWVELASRYEVTFKSSHTKAEIKKLVIDKLVGEELLPIEAYSLCPSEGSSASLLLIKKLELEDRAQQREHEREQREKEREHELEVLRMKCEESAKDREVKMNTISDLGHHVKFMPRFNETEVENFFDLFERVAKQLNWPKDQWCFFCQTAFTGKAELIYASLPTDTLTYEQLKKVILNAYGQIPEYHRQQFRNLTRGETQTYLEFVKEKERLYKAWLRSSKVTTFEELSQLIMLEEILRKVPYSLKLYLQEREVTTVDRAAALADNYRLTHGDSFYRRKQKGSDSAVSSSGSSRVGGGSGVTGGGNGSGASQVPNKFTPGSTVSGKTVPVKTPYSSNLTCAYCKQSGHHIRDCSKLKGKDKRPESVLATSCILNLPISDPATSSFNQTPNPTVLSAGSNNLTGSQNHVLAGDDLPSCVDQFRPFRSFGTVSCTETSTKYPIHILRDTGASHSLVLKGVIPDLEDCYLGQSVLIQGISGCIAVPLARVHLNSDLAKGYFTVGVQESLPVQGVNFVGE